MLDWLIIGAGVHGVHLALALLSRAGVERDRIRLLDPHPNPLARWRQCSATVGMRFMRSPSVHHLDGPPFSLSNFARERGYNQKREFRPPYNRPSRRLFDEHCDALLASQRIAELCIRGRAVALTERGDRLEVEVEVETETETETITASRVVLALGSDRLARPAWAEALARDGLRLAHVFDDDFDASTLADADQLVVVGGGISAVQFALAQSRNRTSPVTLLTRKPLREAQFDSDPGWLGPLHLDGFRREPDMSRRRAMIDAARNRGTVPRDVLREFRRAERRGRVEVHEAQIIDARVARHGGVELWPQAGPIRSADRVVLATGFARARPGAWLDQSIAELGLPCAECGYPIVDRALRWHPRIHVSGGLAELELGPAARNVSGARMASERLLEHLCERRSVPRGQVVRLGTV
ncbi:FAD dependent oxidoreductase [Enhygromyxa salina]|uniref:FAD dependent oxidoreductase n=1 Tax=Enhygromyxa salina TaxID=215803 RepID=A0A2S9YFM4_9BACT|nr:FAD/NAD(P)-binding protein [Enhygromyxa salina]PRQ03842.1 FAD dependent oxidoreductase [Enhygromyxa salina]